MSILDFIKITPHAIPIQDQQEIDKTYKYWRFRVFYAMYIGYALFYFTRKSFAFAMPAMMSELGMTKHQLALLGGILYCTYGMSKFISGVLSDKSNPRFIMSLGLMLTGIFNIFFGFSNTFFLFALFWGLNGWFQGWGWPPCARLLTHWYSQNERGTWWGAWNTSHNVGGAVIPLFVAAAVHYFGSWRFAMWAPGVVCLLGGFFLFDRLRDTPQSLGLPPIETYRQDIQVAEEAQAHKDATLSAKQILVEYVLRNKFIWVLAIAYFFVYVIRTAVNDWGLMFLTEARGLSLVQAGWCMALFEVGGCVGGLAGGWCSDKIFGSKRGPINVLFMLGAIFALAVIWLGSAQISLGMYVFYLSAMFIMGFFIFGPQMLIGMAAVELSHKKAAGTATGFVGWFAYFGAAFSGFLAAHGWGLFFIGLAACGAISLLLLIPLWSAQKIPHTKTS